MLQVQMSINKKIYEKTINIDLLTTFFLNDRFVLESFHRNDQRHFKKWGKLAFLLGVNQKVTVTF